MGVQETDVGGYNRSKTSFSKDNKSAKLKKSILSVYLD